MIWNIALDPAFPLPVLYGLGGISLLVAALGVRRRARGTGARALLSLLLIALLLNPHLAAEEREALPDIALLLVDESPSQRLAGRAARTEAALARIEAAAAEIEGLDLRTIRYRPEGVADRTDLLQMLERARAEIPMARYGGAVILSDGQVHDVPSDAAEVGALAEAPLHLLLTGDPSEVDRRLSLTEAPAFALVDQPVSLTFRVDDLGPGTAPSAVPVTLSIDGEEVSVMNLPTGQEISLPVTVDRAGPSIISLAVPPLAGELTSQNNEVAFSLSGVRDRLRVLLVSGEPHPGERMWRDVLKSDPAVDLVHFTILRPPDRIDTVPINEMSLIAFPVQELFEIRLSEFDLVVFDRYRRRAVLTLTYFENIARYVEQGGAFLEASGPPFASSFSLYQTGLNRVLPGAPTGRITEQPFLPTVTALGARHPVTAGLQDGWDGEWGRWFRLINVVGERGQTVMTGPGDQPLLMLDRVGEGRVAQLASDQIWLWARGFEGGGPDAELLRRMVHWLMQEPELEEERLTAAAEGDEFVIRRHSLSDTADPATIIGPDGRERIVPLAPVGEGVAEARISVDQPGVHRVVQGSLSTLGVVGALDTPELRDMRQSAEPLAPLIEAAGGGIHQLSDGVPDLRTAEVGRAMAGGAWIALQENGAYRIIAVESRALLPAWLAFVMVLLLVGAAWWRESR